MRVRSCIRGEGRNVLSEICEALEELIGVVRLVALAGRRRAGWCGNALRLEHGRDEVHGQHVDHVPHDIDVPLLAIGRDRNRLHRELLPHERHEGALVLLEVRRAVEQCLELPSTFISSNQCGVE